MSRRLFISPSWYPAADGLLAQTPTQSHRTYQRTTTHDPINCYEKAEYFLYGPEHIQTHATLLDANLDDQPEPVWYTEAILAAAYAGIHAGLSLAALDSAVIAWACHTPPARRHRHVCNPYPEHQNRARLAQHHLDLPEYIPEARIRAVLETARTDHTRTTR